MFYCRDKELIELNKRYESSKFELMVVYGRRRIGKTELLKEFIQEKKTVFFSAKKESELDALKRMSKAVAEIYPEIGAVSEYFENWDKLFAYLELRSQEERIIIIIDEYPYLADSVKSMSTYLQNRIDHHLKDSNVMMILCGSSVSFMEEKVLAYQSPLYGRRTGQMKLKPFTLKESQNFFPDISAKELIKVYGIVGGIPLYLNYLADKETMEEAILDLYLNPYGYLYGEASGFLQQELREPGIYNSILTAIAGGASKLNQIATKIGEETAKVSKYLKTLENLHVIEKELPAGMGAKKGGIYSITDNMFRFWYRYIPNNLSLIDQGKSDYVYTQYIRDDLDRFMGYSFESVCKQYLAECNGSDKIPFVFRDIGRFWGNDPVKKKEIEIDIVASSEDKILVGECKWRNEPVSEKVFRELEEKSRVIAKGRQIYYVLFSKSGYTKGMVELANGRTDIYLIVPEMMV